MCLKLLPALAERILGQFSSRPAFCFAYGSGVKLQHGYDEAAFNNTLIDLILCVDDAKKFHSENLAVNPSHYAGIKVLGPSALSRIQENYGAKVYCNTLIPLEGRQSMKYGVISTRHLIADLNDWTDLYVAGRMQKPFHVLSDTVNEELKLAIEQNYRNAVRVALLLLPVKFKRYDLFYTIANLSYAGDFRMIFGEKKNKVRNIVEPQINEFYEIYRPYLKEFKWCLHMGSEDSSRQTLQQDKAPHAMRRLIQHLPHGVLDRLLLDEILERKEDGVWRLSSSPEMSKLLEDAVNNIVWRSSATQSLKNIPTAGLMKSVRYGCQKALKTFSK